MTDTNTPTEDWNGVPPNGQGMYHWLVNKDHGRHVVAWFDLHEWTAFGMTRSKQETAATYNYLAPCDPPTPRPPVPDWFLANLREKQRICGNVSVLDPGAVGALAQYQLLDELLQQATEVQS